MNYSEATQELIQAHSTTDYTAVLANLDEQATSMEAELVRLANQHAELEVKRQGILADRDQIATLAGQVNG